MGRQGITVDELIVRTQEKEKRDRQAQMERRDQIDKASSTAARGYASAITPVDEEADSPDIDDDPAATSRSFTRKDSSPVKVGAQQTSSIIC